MALVHRADVADGLDHVSGPGLALGAQEGRALADAAQGLAEIAAPADEGDRERVLVHVVLLVRGGQDLALVDEVDAERLEHSRLREMADAALGHHRDGDGVHDPLDDLGVGHARDAAVAADVRGDPLEGHDRHRACVFGDPGLGLVGHVHDDPALQHLRETRLQPEAAYRRAHAHFLSRAAPASPWPATAAAAVRMASTDWSASASVVDQFETEMRITSWSRQREPPEPGRAAALDARDDRAGEGVRVPAARGLEANQHLVEHHLVEDAHSWCARPAPRPCAGPAGSTVRSSRRRRWRPRLRSAA